MSNRNDVRYAVNYGVNVSHKGMNTIIEKTYKAALKHYGNIDRAKWPYGEIIRMEFDGGGFVCRKDRKKVYINGTDRPITESDKNLPLNII